MKPIEKFFDLYSRRPLAAIGIVISTLFVVLVMLLYAINSRAADATLSWTLATQNTDGSAIPASGAGSLASTRVEWGSCSGAAFGTVAGTVTVPTPTTTHTITALGVATYCFRAFSRNSYGVESAASLVVSKIIPAPTPNPPVLSATITVAYEVKSHPVEGTMLGRNVGSVEIGTPCLEQPIVYTMSGTYYEIPLDKVHLTKMPKSAIVVTKCSVRG